MEGFGIKDPRRIARRYKLLSHVYFPDDDTIWVDGRVRLLKPVSYYFEHYTADMACRLHHARQCVYEEAKEITKINYDDPRVVGIHLAKLKQIKYPKQNGLHETGAVLRRNTPEVREFNRLWWEWLSTGSKRDQLSFDPCVWLTGITVDQIDRNEVLVTQHRRRTSATL